MAGAAVSKHSQAMQDLASADKNRQDRAYESLLEMTNAPVSWAYEVWDQLLHLAVAGNNRQRSIAGQILSSLAKSDPKERIVKDVDVLIALTRDERFVTARHCLQSLWKVAVVGDRHLKAITAGLIQRFHECASEKNCTLLRYDIQCVFQKLYELTGDKGLRSSAEKLIDLEPDPKYRKKYATVWRSAAPRR